MKGFLEAIMNYRFQFQSLEEFLIMPGIREEAPHGFYVWLAFGLTALVVIWNIVLPWLQRRRLLKQLAQQLRREKKNAPSA